MSPDGKYVAAIRAGQVILVPLDDTGEVRVIAGLAPTVDRVAQWTSDSQALYVYQDAGRKITVSLLDPKTGQRRQWKEIPVSDVTAVMNLRVTPDGQTWAYSGTRFQSNLYLVEGLH